jgi:hypothetical protein
MAIKTLRQKVVRLPTNNQKPIPPDVSTVERAEYMADMIMQLKDMAAVGGLPVLSGILEVAYQEARAQARRT